MAPEKSNRPDPQSACLGLIAAIRQKTTSKQEIEVLGKKFVLLPEVFDPNFTPGPSHFNAEECLKIIKSEAGKASVDPFKVLNVGAGVGHIAVLAALASEKCYVWATDINAAAVENASENAALHGVSDRVKTGTGNVFKVPEIQGQKFDLICWVYPCTQADESIAQSNGLERALLDPNYEGLRSYLSEAREFLKESGKLIIVFSHAFGNSEEFYKVVKENKWETEVRAKAAFPLPISPVDADFSVLELLNRA